MSRLFAGTPFDIPPDCELCGVSVDDCTCTEEQKAAAELEQKKRDARIAPEKQKARVSVGKRKGGRKATVVDGLTAEANDLPELLAKLQAVCGTGGTVKASEDRVELQGDHSAAVRKELQRIGYRV
ncbi:MAG: translation initiation factor [Planctomycetota bacterium]